MSMKRDPPGYEDLKEEKGDVVLDIKGNKSGTKEKLTPERQFLEACKKGDVDAVKEWCSKKNVTGQKIDIAYKLEKHVDQNAAGGPREVTGPGDTGLHLAAEAGRLDVCKVLLNNEAPIEEKNKIGSTPLHLAAAHGHLDVVKFFLESKAMLHAKNMIGNTPLHMAVLAGNKDVVEALLKASDNPARDLEDSNVCQVRPAECAHDKEILDLLKKYKRGGIGFDTAINEENEEEARTPAAPAEEKGDEPDGNAAKEEPKEENSAVEDADSSPKEDDEPSKGSASAASSKADEV